MRTLLATAVVCAASLAHAETKIAVPDMKVTGAEPSLGPILTEIMTTETSRVGDIVVLGSSDISAMLGFEQEKQLLGCADDVSCMAEIGGALGVDLLLVSDLGLVGDTHVLNLKLIDAAKVKVINRVYRTVTGKADALIGAVRKAVPELLAPVAEGRGTTPAEAETRPVEGPHDFSPPEKPVTPAVEEAHEIDTGPSTWMQWTVIGVGGATVLAAVGLQIAAKNEYDKGWNSYEVGDNQLYSRSLEDSLTAAAGRSKAALGCWIAGGLLTAGGLTWLLLTPDSETALAVAPTQGGAALTLTGGF